VITADVPLASRCVKAGAEVLAPNGKSFTKDSIGMTLATRNLMDSLRSAGEITGGPKPFAPRDRSAFLSALDQAIVRLDPRRIWACNKKTPGRPGAFGAQGYPGFLTEFARARQAALRFTPASATEVSFLSVAFSSSSVCCNRPTTSWRPSCLAHAMSVP
jgi:hypothetical protein